ncbi:MAG: hypothetical protein AMJ75_00230 [Phycisphaerae bacterium SM1_79]|nr:MAG: hypothetical protein AMJ75_00230 [Phycisphaerae bacterium SM1_79]
MGRTAAGRLIHFIMNEPKLIYTYTCGRTLEAEDLGTPGLILSLSGDKDDDIAIYMDDDAVREFHKWLSNTCCLNMSTKLRESALTHNRGSHTPRKKRGPAQEPPGK